MQMIVYDDGVMDDYAIDQHKHQQAARHTFTEADAPPSRVQVRTEQIEVPRPISPPAQIGTSAQQQPPDAPLAGASPQSTAAAAQSVALPTNQISLMNSPPLPSFVKQTEHNVENPFRPEEQLYHEVGPIVEMYRQRPFPPSPSHGSPVPPHEQQQETPTRNQQQQQQPMNEISTTPTRMTTTTAMSPNRGEIVLANGGGGGGRHSSLAEARREANNQRQMSPVKTELQQQQEPLIANSAAVGDGVGPPGRAEVVRLPEKKKRACCSLQ